MSDDNLFLEDQHPTSRRFAIFEDDGTSAWLYITKPDMQTPVADVWVYNRIPAPPTEEVPLYRGGPPPAPVGYARDTAFCRCPTAYEWSFIWSRDGESVAITKDGVAVACIVAAQKPGHGRELMKNGPWGNTWSEELFLSVFSYVA
ncbi:hypothetical protein ANRL1_01662 [Anaerolineae bacterium]|nr:hypothetical protein ANRL1_01662 [Anaerolineae bacterium]